MMKFNEFLRFVYSNDIELVDSILQTANYSRDLSRSEKHQYAIHSGVTIFTQNRKEMALLYLPETGKVAVQLHERGMTVPAMNGVILQRNIRGYYSEMRKPYINRIVVDGNKEICNKIQCHNLKEIPFKRTITGFGLKDEKGEITLISHIPIVTSKGTEITRYPLRKQYGKSRQYNGVSFKKIA
ncbi:MAG: hypothetical protein PHU97_08105 [Bacteroidales bacterium]|nr:hypothetical protein [Bacteroidales bacterium]MDD3960524.1 hypothetical protein [Bacteroidales bacterium]